jgi:hypothetical protein
MNFARPAGSFSQIDASLLALRRKQAHRISKQVAGTITVKQHRGSVQVRAARRILGAARYRWLWFVIGFLHIADSEIPL